MYYCHRSGRLQIYVVGEGRMMRRCELSQAHDTAEYLEYLFSYFLGLATTANRIRPW